MAERESELASNLSEEAKTPDIAIPKAPRGMSEERFRELSKGLIDHLKDMTPEEFLDEVRRISPDLLPPDNSEMSS